MSSVLNGLRCFEEVPVLLRRGPALAPFHEDAVKVAVGDDESPREEETRRPRPL